MLDLDDMVVLVLFKMFVLPHSFVWDVDAIAAEGDNGVNVGFERVAYHEKLGRIDTKFCAEIYVVLLTLIGSDFNVMEQVIKS